MSSIKCKHIVAGLVVAFVIIFLFAQGNKDKSYDYYGAHNPGPIQSNTSYYSKEIEKAQPYSLSRNHNITNTNRHEILQTKVKGYRESTFWGEETLLDEKAKQMSNDEFDRYIEKVEQNNADVYWGATYKE